MPFLRNGYAVFPEYAPRESAWREECVMMKKTTRILVLVAAVGLCVGELGDGTLTVHLDNVDR